MSTGWSPEETRDRAVSWDGSGTSAAATRGWDAGWQQVLQEQNYKNLYAEDERALAQHQHKLKKRTRRRERFSMSGFIFKWDSLLQYFLFFEISLFHIPQK